MCVQCVRAPNPADAAAGVARGLYLRIAVAVGAGSGIRCGEGRHHGAAAIADAAGKITETEAAGGGHRSGLAGGESGAAPVGVRRALSARPEAGRAAAGKLLSHGGSRDQHRGDREDATKRLHESVLMSVVIASLESVDVGGSVEPRLFLLRVGRDRVKAICTGAFEFGALEIEDVAGVCDDAGGARTEDREPARRPARKKEPGLHASATCSPPSTGKPGRASRRPPWRQPRARLGTSAPPPLCAVRMRTVDVTANGQCSLRRPWSRRT